MKHINWVFIGAAAALLCACASGGGHANSGIEVDSQTATEYPAVANNACRVSSYPPKGTYVVIAQLKATGQPGESSTQVLHRLQQQGAALGSTYVMVTSVSDKTFVNPQTSEIDDNPYLSQENSFFNTASPDGVTYNHEFDTPPVASAPVITAQALKITSGTNKPNKAAPSNLWQLRAN